MKALFVVSLALLSACGNGPCGAYVAAANACFEEADKAGADVDVEKGSADEFCKDMGDEFSDEGWECLTETLKDADCSTDTGLNEWMNEADDCPK